MERGIKLVGLMQEIEERNTELGDSLELQTATSEVLRIISAHPGDLRTALRATISLPGILPPVVEGEDILVDGAVLNNFPAGIMREMHQGFVIGSDVSGQPEGLNLEEYARPLNFWQWVIRNGFSSPPPIAGLLMRAATVRNDPLYGRDMTDVMILPDLPGIELRDWTAYDEAVEAGYVAAKAALENSEIPQLCCPP